MSLVANTLEEAVMEAVEISDVCGHCGTLIVWNFEVVRESATREARSDFGVGLSAADASDKGTCERMPVQ